MKTVLKIVVLLLVLVVASLCAVYTFGQQTIVDTLARHYSQRYGLTITVSEFDIAVWDGTLSIGGVKVLDGDNSILIEGIKSSISLRDLYDGTVVIERCVLASVDIKNAQAIVKKFSSQSAPSSQSSEDGIKLPFVLEGGRIARVRVSENLGDGKTLKIRDGDVRVETTVNGGLLVGQTLKGVELVDENSDTLNFGDVTGEEVLEGTSVSISSLRATSGLADLSATKLTVLPVLSGELVLSTSAERVPVPRNIDTALRANLVLSGTIKRPVVTAEIQTVSGVSIDSVRRLDSVDARVTYSKNDAGFSVAVERLDARGALGYVSVARALRYSNGDLSGDLQINLKELSLEGFGFLEFSGKASLKGKLARPQVDSEFSLRGLKTGPLSFGDINVTSRYDRHFQTLEVIARETPTESGSLELSSVLSFGNSISQTTTATFSRKLVEQGLSIEGKIDGSGPLDIRTAKASATVTGDLSRDNFRFPFIGQGELENGQVKIHLNQEKLVDALITLDITEKKSGHAKITVDQPKLSSWFPSIACGGFKLFSEIGFPLADPSAGTGTLSFQNATLGCGRYAIKISAKPLRLENRSLRIESMEFGSLAGVLTAAGRVSREALEVGIKGSIELPFIGHLNSIVNDVAGTATIDMQVAGTPNEPALRGKILVSNVAATVSQPVVELSGVNATATFDGSKVFIQDLGGIANEGTFKAAGEVDVKAPLETLLATLQLDNVSISPIQDTEVWFSSDLKAVPKEINGAIVPSISGTISIKDGKLEKNFDQAFIQERIRTFFDSTRVTAPSKKEAVSIPDLDLKISGDGSFAVVTNLARADVSPALTIKGNPKELSIRGTLGIASGSFDVGRTHFEISSGRVSLWSQRVRLELFAEGEAKDENGFPIVIFLELSGDASDPRVTLTSDNGLTQEEIVKLLAAGGGLGGQAILDQVVSAAGLNELGLLTEDSWISRLTGVDDLSIEPSYDLATGQTSSKVYTAKQLTDEIRLSGQFPFTGQGQSKISTEYGVTSFLGIEGSYRPPSPAFQSSAGVDLNWAVVSNKRRWPLEFEGNETFSRITLINALGLSRRSRISDARLVILERKIKRYYVDRGFLDVSVSTKCKEGCSFGLVTIAEGTRSIIREVAKIGNLDLAGTLIEKDDSIIGQPATKATLQAVLKSLIVTQRTQGYFRARIVTHFERIPDSNDVKLFVKGWKRQKYVFKLEGNMSVSFDQFAKELRLYEQSFPFGPNLPGEFITAVEQHYLERGFADLRITSYLTNDGEVVTLRLVITEGKIFKVKEVDLANSPVSKDTISKGLSAGDAKNIFRPPVLYRASVQYGRTRIEDFLVQQGYPQARVFAEEIRLGGDTAKVVYTVESGKPQKYQVRVEGLPLEVQAPELVDGSSLEALKRETERLRGRMTRAGYKAANVELVITPDSDRAAVRVIAGSVETIESVVIVGNQRIDEETISKALDLKPGSALSLRLLSQARNRVLKLGLFSEVSITPDEKTKVVTVTVRERALQSVDITTGYDSTFGVHLGTNAVDRALFSDGRELSLRGDVYYDYDNAELGRGFGALRFKDPELFDSTSWIEELGFTSTQESAIQEFDLTSVYLRSELQYTVNSKARIQFGHVAESLRVANMEPDVVLSEDDVGTFISSALVAGVEYTDQDDPLTPRYARRGTIEAHLARSEFGSEADFVTIQPSALFLVPTGFFDNRLSLLASGKAGFGYVFGDTQELPLAKRFRLGGQNSVRGYRENSLGPRGELGSVIGGDVYYQATGEVRYEAIDRMQVLTFLDFGRLSLDSIGKGRNNFGAGIGVRYGSPIGSLGADIGVPINPEDNERRPRFYLRLGATF